MSVLIVAEHDNQTVKDSTLHTITAGMQLHEDVHVLLCGAQCGVAAEKIAALSGVKKVLLADNAVYEHQLAENSAELITQLGKEYEFILAPATTFGKNLMPRVAALLNVGQVSEIVEIISGDTFVRPIYAGNALAKVKAYDSIKVITVRGTAFSAAQTSTEYAPIESVDIVFENKKTEFVEQKLTESERPDLSSARVVVSGGRGLQSAENFKLIEELAEKLNAAIGASRAAVDAGYVPNDYQVGQTGKIVAPELYIAVGISGAIQHIAGMKDSKVIVAINKDADAPIFSIATYGLVGDLFEIVPELNAALSGASLAEC